MKLFSKFFVTLLAAIALFFVACEKEKSFELGSDELYAGKSWQFNDTSTLTYRGIASLYEFDKDNGTMSYSGQTILASEFIQIDLNADTIVPGGVYTSKLGEVTFSYKKSGVEIYAADNIDSVGENLTVTIISIDSNNVSGTFSGTVRNPLGDVIDIREGKFLYTLITTPGPGTDPGTNPGTNPGTVPNVDHFKFKGDGTLIDTISSLEASKVTMTMMGISTTTWTISAADDNMNEYDITLGLTSNDINLNTTYSSSNVSNGVLVPFVNKGFSMYTANMATSGSSFSLKFTKYDKTNKVIAGTFSGTLINGSNKLVVTEGSFQTKYTE